MASHGCINGTLDGTNYSSPVPVIGLYIAAATLVCLLLMLYDVLVGFYTSKHWLPCKWFKLDSITLTLVSVAIKLTVDLTTPMPSVWDQLSKLCGTSLLCAYIGHIMPSVGFMKDSTNMYSLSILVITVFVNMCIQISTGVVVLFITEHIIVMCIMLMLLGFLWHCSWRSKYVTRYSRKTSENLFTNNKETVLERLEICYLYGFGTNAQLLACKDKIISHSIFVLNLICFSILIQATYRSVIIKSEKFCRGNSDYEWSMPIIVLAQILTVVVGSFVSIYRLFTMFEHFRFGINEGEPYKSNPIWKKNNCVKILKALWTIFFIILLCVSYIITSPIYICYTLLKKIFSCYYKLKLLILKLKRIIFRQSKREPEIEFASIIESKLGIDEWTLRKGFAEIKKKRKVHKSEARDLFELFSRNTPSRQLLLVKHSGQVDPNGQSIPVSTLSIVLLVRIAQVCLPKRLNRSLVQTFTDIYAILCFIEKSTCSTNTEFAKKFEVAKAVWLARDFSHLVGYTFDKYSTGRDSQHPDDALKIITAVKRKMPNDMIYNEISSIEHIIIDRRQQHSSIKELSNYIEHLYVDMLRVILAQFPIAAFDALAENPGDPDYHERVRLVLKCFSKIELLEAQINWKLPEGCMGLIPAAAPVLAREEEDGATEEEDSATPDPQDVLQATEGTVTVRIHDADVIIKVEDSNVGTVS